MQIQKLASEEAVKNLLARKGGQRNYAAMYSSWLGGIVTDPSLMIVPIDDHGFHRGDAVFEAIKCVGRKMYGLQRHLERMQTSAEKISLKIPHTIEELTEIAIQTTRASGLSDVLLRYYCSRGPGGFTTNPYESIGAQVYLVITAFKPVAAEKYESGASAAISKVKVKEGFFANVKSCNYLPNVLMKKEAVDQGVDFTVSKDDDGFLAEGSTENFAIVSKDNEFIVPGFERTLKGVTVFRMMELAEKMIARKEIDLKAVRHGHIRSEDVLQAREAMVLGTTLDCLPVTTFDGKKIGSGRAGPIARALQSEMVRDQNEGPLVTKID